MATDSLGRKLDPTGDLVQLALGLVDIDPVEDVENTMSPEEARLNSEAARSVMETLPRLVNPDLTKNEWSWMEDYLHLRDANWPWRVAAFIAWAASPKVGRWPRTQQELASLVLGLSTDRAIGNWRKKNPSIDSTIAIMQAAPLISHRRDIYNALTASASMADHRSNPDRKLALEMLGDYTPHMKIEDERLRRVDGVASMSTEQLMELAGAAMPPSGLRHLRQPPVEEEQEPPSIPPSQAMEGGKEESPIIPLQEGGQRDLGNDLMEDMADA